MILKDVSCAGGQISTLTVTGIGPTTFLLKYAVGNTEEKLLYNADMKFGILHEYLWWFEWIICRKVNGEKKDATLIRTVWLQKQNNTQTS